MSEDLNTYGQESKESYDARLQMAMAALNLALTQLSVLGYQIEGNFEFNKKIDENC